MRGDPVAFEALRVRAGVFIKPGSEDLLREAMRDESFSKEERDQGRGEESNYFLANMGDAVIELAVRTHLRQANSDWTLQRVNEKADEIVQDKALADRARIVSIPPAIDLGVGGERERNNDTTLARAFEATAGAIFLAAGYDTASRLALEWLGVSSQNRQKESGLLRPPSARQDAGSARAPTRSRGHAP